MGSSDGEGTGAAAGGKGTLTTFVVFTLLVNAMNGPGLLAIPTVFQRAGWVPCLLARAAGGYITSETCVFLFDSIAMVRARAGGERSSSSSSSTSKKAGGGGDYGAADTERGGRAGAAMVAVAATARTRTRKKKQMSLSWGWK